MQRTLRIQKVCVCVCEITKNICINEVLVIKTHTTNHINFKWNLAQKFQMLDLWGICSVTSI